MPGLNVMMVMQVRERGFHVGRYSMTRRGISQGEVVFSLWEVYNSHRDPLPRNPARARGPRRTRLPDRRAHPGAVRQPPGRLPRTAGSGDRPTPAAGPRLAPALRATAFDAGGTSFALDEHVVLLVAADPESPERMVAIVAGAPLGIFARLCADSPANPFAFPERAGGTMVWRVAEDGEGLYEAYRL